MKSINPIKRYEWGQNETEIKAKKKKQKKSQNIDTF